MKLYTTVLLAAGLSLLAGSCSILDEVLGYDAFQRAVLDEVNLARAEPTRYAAQRLSEAKAAGTDNGAYAEFMAAKPLPRLKLDESLCRAADDYARYLAEHDVFGHYEDGSPSERCERAGYEHFSGENIAAGSHGELDADVDPKAAAVAFVRMWIIDKGVSGVGHRKNIRGSGHAVIGVGFHRKLGSRYVNYAVQDFGSR